MGVHPNQNWFAALFDVATNQGDVGFATIHFTFVSDQTEFRVARGHQRFSDAMDVAFVLHAIANQLGYR